MQLSSTNINALLEELNKFDWEIADLGHLLEEQTRPRGIKRETMFRVLEDSHFVEKLVCLIQVEELLDNVHPAHLPPAVTQLYDQIEALLDEKRIHKAEVLCLTLEEVRFSARVIKRLRAEGITNLGELRVRTQKYLASIPGLGNQAIHEIIDKLRDLGLTLSQEMD